MVTNNASNSICVKRQFQRSVRLDFDLDRADALNGFVVQPSSRTALSTVAKHVRETQQRAFTWTGPYGGGKSTLALALGQFAGGAAPIRKLARAALHVEKGDDLDNVFGARARWLVLPVVGSRRSVETAIAEVLDRLSPQRGRKPAKDGRRNVIAELLRRAESGEFGGVLLIIDELGKFLEAAAATQADIHFYQELAEAACRANGNLVVIGVLHQAFDQYASRASVGVRAEWSKVQGRFIDIPIVAGTDEVIQLIGQAISCEISHPDSRQACEVVGKSIQKRRPSSSPALAQMLDGCWPLHPATAAILGPCSRRKFGQNERSVFGFLCSSEPLGFKEFIHELHAAKPQTSKLQAIYSPARFWDYLRTNLEPAITSSTDGHRWAAGIEAVERAETRFREPHISLAKTVAILELFRTSSGLAADQEVLETCIQGFSQGEVKSALDDLARSSVLIYRKHLQAWNVYAGSDFDIEAAVASVREPEPAALAHHLRELIDLPPLSARRHYASTGALRWFERSVSFAAVEPGNEPTRPSSKSAGRFELLLPSPGSAHRTALAEAKLRSAAERKAGSGAVLYGVADAKSTILETLIELSALQRVAEATPELDSDPVARREINSRLQLLRGDLDGDLLAAFATAKWYYGGVALRTKRGSGLATLASQVCDELFPSAPTVHSELINRDSLSSNAVKAQRALLHRMLAFGDRPGLAYEGFPADAGLYHTVLVELGIHKAVDGIGRFVPPPARRKGGPNSLLPLWREVEKLLQSRDSAVSLADIYAVARRPPFGVKLGLLPVLLLSFYLAHRSEISLYVEGIYAPELTDAGVDEWLQDPSRISFKWVHVDATKKLLLKKLAARLQQALGRVVLADPLDSARALVSFAYSLPTWTKRTSRLSERAKEARTLLLNASDPVKVIFLDLPEILGMGLSPHTFVESLGAVVEELANAYSSALRSIEKRMLVSLDHDGSFETLRMRARVVHGISGDLRLDAFAGRLSVYAGEVGELEGLISLATNKPTKDLTDYDFDQATTRFAEWALEFRRIEAIAGIHGRKASRRAIAVIFGTERTRSRTFDVAESNSANVSDLAARLLKHLESTAVTKEMFLAALAEAGASVLDSEVEETAQ